MNDFCGHQSATSLQPCNIKKTNQQHKTRNFIQIMMAVSCYMPQKYTGLRLKHITVIPLAWLGKQGSAKYNRYLKALSIILSKIKFSALNVTISQDQYTLTEQSELEHSLTVLLECIDMHLRIYSLCFQDLTAEHT